MTIIIELSIFTNNICIIIMVSFNLFYEMFVSKYENTQKTLSLRI